MRRVIDRRETSGGLRPMRRGLFDWRYCTREVEVVDQMLHGCRGLYGITDAVVYMVYTLI